MLSTLEARAALTGLGRLLRFDPSFAQWFDRSSAGALRSFRLMLLALPSFIIIVLVAVSQQPDITLLRLVAGSSIVYLLSWILFPLSLILIGRALERETQAIGVITFYNWYTGTILVIQSLLSLLAYSGALGSVPDIASKMIFYGALLFEGFAFRTLMGIGLGGAFLLVLLEYSISEGLMQIWVTLLFGRPFF